jgi:hypothetical protein
MQKESYKNFGKRQTVIFEIVTQWTARRTYPEFLNALGGSAAHFDDIKKNGLGYHLRIKNFDRLLEVLNVDETEMFTEMKRLIDTVSSPRYYDELKDFLSIKSGVRKPKMKAIFVALEKNENYFEDVLKKMGLID